MTIAQQLKITEFPFIIKDKKGKEIYYESSTGSWYKYEYDQNGNPIYFENSTGGWYKYEYDQNGKAIYCEDSTGFIVDKRPKVVELTLDDIAAKLNIDVNLLKIKK
jgi:YD repeat-containing protein